MLGYPFIAVLAAAAAAISAYLTSLLVRFSLNWKLVAKPRSDRWHKCPIPDTGGIAIVVAITVLYPLIPGSRYSVIVAAAVSLAVLGFLDDRIQLKPLTKLAGQCIVAGAVIVGGTVFQATRSEIVNVALTFLWIIGVTNAFNLIDNMDGLCAGATIIISSFRFCIAVQVRDYPGATLFAILAGVYLGFLFFNYRPARIFMGDTGSMFAGFMLASLSIASPVPHRRVFATALFYPTLTFLYPIFDTALVSLLRRAAGRPISVGGRDHSSHRLASIGLDERRVVWVLWALTASGSAAALFTTWMPFGVIAVGALLVLGVTLFGVFLATLPSYPMPDAAPVCSRHIRALLPTLRAGIILVVDVFLAGIALLCAFLIRWEDAFPGRPMHQFFVSLPVVMACHAFACLTFRAFSCGWRWFGIHDLITIVKSVALGSGIAIFILWMTGLRDYSRGVVLLYMFLLTIFAAALRGCLRILWETLVPPSGRRKAAVLGSSPAAEVAVLILQRQTDTDTVPVMVLDTDPATTHLRIHGVPIRYAGSDPVGVLKRAGAELLLLPPNGALTESQQHVVTACQSGGFSVCRLELAMKALECRVG